MKQHHIVFTAALALVAGCASPESSAEAQPVATTHSELGSELRSPQYLQPGQGQRLLGVTSDNHLLYQEGREVFATALESGAQRSKVADVPAGNFAYVYVSGKVAFCWSNPDWTRPGLGVSPLVIWSAATGANLADEASPIGTFASAASPDGASVIYPANSNAAQTAGDLAFASTDLSVKTTLAAQIPMGFPFGFCRPWAAFAGEGGGARPVALFCQPGQSTSTLALWTGATRTDLLTGGATPPFFTADRSGTSFFTTLAPTATTPPIAVVVSEGKAPVVVDQLVARTGFIMNDGSVVYISRAGGGVSVRRFNPEDSSRTVVTDRLLNFITPLAGSDLVTKPWFSADRKKLSYFTAVAPNGSGLIDQHWADVSGQVETFVADPQPRNWNVVPTFTGDSKYFLSGRSTDLANGLGVFVAQSEGRSVEFSDERGWSYLPAEGPNVAFIDNFDGPSFTGDLRVADVSQKVRARLISTQVDANYLVSPDGRWVVFTKSLDAATAGIYAARAQL